jgi:2-keto-4-pentenoate hydratase/2-oxohepta-3-ene-1,7-dioic acid hydratase in catechol pathway
VRLVTYSEAGSGSRLGVEASGGTIHDLTDALGVTDVGEMLARGITVGDVEDLRVRARTHEPGEVAIRAPIRRPGKIICVGLNYHDHCREQGAEPPPYPMLFSKFANAVAHPGASVTRPVATEQLDLECELAVVIGRRASRIGPSEASEVIFGYTILNDVTMRDLQREDRQWLRAKGSDGFAPMGPAVVTADELGDPQALTVRSSVNGETWQDSTTAEMIFDVLTVVAFASRTITLEPGDVIATGTPAGVGHYQRPPRYLADGDLMRCEISGIGAIENRVVDEAPRVEDHAEAAGVGSIASRAGSR